MSDWVIGGSNDARAVRQFGFGPHVAAVIAVEAFTVAVDVSDGIDRDEFCRRCAAAFLIGLRDAAGLDD